MKFSSSAIVAAALVAGASAHPSGHGHAHLHRRTDFVQAVRPAPEPSAQIMKEAKVEKPKHKQPKPSTTELAAPSPTSDTTTSPTDSGDDDSDDGKFCDGALSKRATLAEIAYKGNVGAPGNYGCNYKKVSSGAAKNYKYVVEAIEGLGKDQKCVAYNKIGPEDKIDGFFSGKQAMDFDLPAGQTAYIAVDKNTQGGIICGAGKIPLSVAGQFGNTWAEFDFENDSNNGWSGADASSIVAAANDMAITAMKMVGCGTSSIINTDGTGKNAFVGGTEAEDGIGLNCAPGPQTIKVTFGSSS